MIVPLLIATLLFASVALVLSGLRARKPATSTMESRIQELRTRSVALDPDDVDLEVPFLDRVLKPSVEGLAHAVSAILPASVLSDIQEKLTMAGNPMRLNSFVTFWVVCSATMIGLGVVIFIALPPSLMLQKVAFGLLFGILGIFIPRLWLSGKVKSRQKTVIKAMPDALDLITTCVEAGLGLDAALARVAEKSTGPLADELSRMLRDVAMGKLRRDALQELADRVGVEELTSFITSIIQAEQLGVSIAPVLRVQSDQLRTKRRQRAERQAHEAPIKMIFPLVLFIFPAFLVVILGPAMIRISGAMI